jgi:hypothetical protein
MVDRSDDDIAAGRQERGDDDHEGEVTHGAIMEAPYRGRHYTRSR